MRSIYCPTQTERNLTLIVLDFSNKLKSSKSSLCHANRWLEKREKKKKKVVLTNGGIVTRDVRFWSLGSNRIREERWDIETRLRKFNG